MAAAGAGPLKTVAIRLAQIGATILVTVFVARAAGLGLAELRSLDLGGWAPSPLILTGSCLALLGGYFLSAWLWGRIVAGLGGGTLGSRDSVRLYMVANLGRYVPGKLWQIGALAALARRRGVPAATATAAAVLLQGIALASASLLGLWSLWTLADGAAWRWLLPAGIVLCISVGLTPPVFRALTGLWFRLARTPEPPELRPRDVAGWLALGLLNWMVYAGAFWVLVLGLGLDVALVASGSAFAAAYVVGYVAIFAPAGVGVREASLLALLTPQLGPSTAAAVAVIARIWTTLVEVVPAGAFWFGGLVGAAPDPAAGGGGGTDV